MNGRYILDPDGNPTPEPDLLKWAEWYEHGANRIVRQDQIGDMLVSTVFLGLDHGFGHEHKRPVLWETMIFRGKHEAGMQRYCTRDEALKGHNEAVEMVKARLKNNERMV